VSVVVLVDDSSGVVASLAGGDVTVSLGARLSDRGPKSKRLNLAIEAFLCSSIETSVRTSRRRRSMS
jgi:hypothetical protein